MPLKKMSERQIPLMINAIRYGHGKRKIFGKLYLIIHKYLQYKYIVPKLMKNLSKELSSYRKFIGFRMLVFCVSIFFINTLYILYYLSIIKANILLLVPLFLTTVNFLKVTEK